MCSEYVAYTKNHFGQCTIIFDGHDIITTKVAEQERRVSRNVSATIIFTNETVMSNVQKRDILNNRENKDSFINLLMRKLQEAGNICLQVSQDADHMIAFSALSTSATLDHPVILVVNDTDLLAILVDQANLTTHQQLYLQDESNPLSLYRIVEIQQPMAAASKAHILVAHAFTGYDTASAIYKIGMKKIMTLLSKSNRQSWDFQEKHRLP